MTPNDSLKPTAEQLMKWKESGVLFEGSFHGKDSRFADWFGPFEFDTYPCKHADGDVYLMVRPYRAPGHIQPHDGSPERPSHVALQALVAWLDDECEPEIELACDVTWDACNYYIVFPEPKP